MEDFKVHLKDLEKKDVSKWIVIPFDLEIKNADSESHLEDELIDVCESWSSEVKSFKRLLEQCEYCNQILKA